MTFDRLELGTKFQWSNACKGLVHAKETLRLSIRYLAEDCSQKDQTLSIRGKFRTQFYIEVLFRRSLPDPPRQSRTYVLTYDIQCRRAKLTTVSQNFPSYSIAID